MKDSELVAFLHANIEPLLRGSSTQFRASAYLTDGTYLPCVLCENREQHVNSVLGRLQHAEKSTGQYRSTVMSHFDVGMQVSSLFVSRVEPSPFAWPLRLLQHIHGETYMGFTAFVAEMNDGTMFSYDVASMAERFYDLPAGYTVNDIKKIYSGGPPLRKILVDFKMSRGHISPGPYHERPCFYCFVEGL